MTPGSGRSLGERTSAMRGDDAGRAATPGGADLPEASGGRAGPTHCWVQDPPEAAGRWPAVLLRWSQSSSGQWRGQVAYAFRRGSEVVLVEAWLDASRLRRH